MVLFLPEPEFTSPGEKVGEALLTVTPNDSPAICLLLLPVTLCFTGREVLVPRGGMLLPGDTMIPLN